MCYNMIMAQQKPDNKPPASPKLLKFTGSTIHPEAEAKVLPVPEKLVDQALAIALFDAGAVLSSKSTANVASIESFSAPNGKRALKVREKTSADSSSGTVESLPIKDADKGAGAGSLPKRKKKSP
jgi:hypothetical protein